MHPGQETPTRLIDAAIQVIDASGPHSLTLRAIGDAAGLSCGAPYRHFRDKRALLDAVGLKLLHQFNATLEEAMLGAASPLGALKRAVGAYLDYARRFPTRYRLLFDDREAGRARGQQGTQARRIFERLSSLVAAAQQAQEIKAADPPKIASLIWSAMHGWSMLDRSGRSMQGIATAEEVVMLLLELVDGTTAQDGEQPALVAQPAPSEQLAGGI